MVVVALLFAALLFASRAEATCFSSGGKPKATVPNLAYVGQDGARADHERDGDDDDRPDGPRASIVGLWSTEFLLGEGPDLFEQTFQQFHADGLELILTNGVPPVMGNVCVGVWKQVGWRTVKLRHMSWNWDPAQPALPLPSAQFAGTYVLEATFVVSRNGRTLRGTWTAASYDPSGVLVPGSEFSGVVRGTRITAD
jgi:hypothetical protein